MGAYALWLLLQRHKFYVLNGSDVTFESLEIECSFNISDEQTSLIVVRFDDALDFLGITDERHGIGKSNGRLL